MSDEIKEYLDTANFKFKDIDENGVEKELTLSETIEKLIEDNKRLADYITNLQQELENKNNEIDVLKDQVEWWKQQCDDLEMQIGENNG